MTPTDQKDPYPHLVDLNLIEKALSGDTEAWNLIHQEALALTEQVASHYVEQNGPSMEELKTVGTTYLTKALQLYSQDLTNKEFKFSTYFTWWIKTSIETYLGISKEPLQGIKPRTNPS